MLYSNKGFQDLSQIFYSDKFIVTLWTDYCTSLSFCEITLTFSLYRHSIIKRIYNFYLLNPSSICSISSNGWHSLPKKKYSVISWWIQVLWMTLNFYYRHGGWEKRISNQFPPAEKLILVQIVNELFVPCRSHRNSERMCIKSK